MHGRGRTARGSLARRSQSSRYLFYEGGDRSLELREFLVHRRQRTRWSELEEEAVEVNLVALDTNPLVLLVLDLLNEDGLRNEGLDLLLEVVLDVAPEGHALAVA